MWGDWRDILDIELDYLNNPQWTLTPEEKAKILRRTARRLDNPPAEDEIDDYLDEKGLLIRVF